MDSKFVVLLCLSVLLCTGTSASREGSAGTNVLRSLSALDYQTCKDIVELHKLLRKDKAFDAHVRVGRIPETLTPEQRQLFETRPSLFLKFSIVVANYWLTFQSDSF